MKLHRQIAALLAAALLPLAASAGELDERLIGEWEGMRERDGACQFLAWRSQFHADGRFEITFFRDAERAQKIQTERGIWRAADGRSELRTLGVPTPEVYEYRFLDEDRVHLTNTKKDATADCQADYEFTETRVRR